MIGKVETGQAVTPCRLEACDPRTPYRVNGGEVRFLTFESDQNSDLDPLLLSPPPNFSLARSTTCRAMSASEVRT